MPHSKDHQGRTLEEEYRKILKSEGSDRAVINFLLTERYYAVKTMIMVRNESFETVIQSLMANVIQHDKKGWSIPDEIYERVKRQDDLVNEWKHVADMKDHPIK